VGKVKSFQRRKRQIKEADPREVEGSRDREFILANLTRDNFSELGKEFSVPSKR